MKRYNKKGDVETIKAQIGSKDEIIKHCCELMGVGFSHYDDHKMGEVINFL